MKNRQTPGRPPLRSLRQAPGSQAAVRKKVPRPIRELPVHLDPLADRDVGVGDLKCLLVDRGAREPELVGLVCLLVVDSGGRDVSRVHGRDRSHRDLPGGPGDVADRPDHAAGAGPLEPRRSRELHAAQEHPGVDGAGQGNPYVLHVLLLVTRRVLLNIRQAKRQPVQVEFELAARGPVQVPRGLGEWNDVAEVALVRVQEVVAVQVLAVLEAVVVRTVRARVPERPGRRVGFRPAACAPQARVVLVPPHADDGVHLLVEIPLARRIAERIGDEGVFVDRSNVDDQGQARVRVVHRRSVELEEFARRQVDPGLRQDRGHREPAGLTARRRVFRRDPHHRFTGPCIENSQLRVDLKHEQ